MHALLLGFVTYTLCFHCCWATPAQKVVKDGFYKMINVQDGAVLTVTRKGGRPYHVYTEEWSNLPTQHWKVKSQALGDAFLQIIRNEEIRDNEITKEPTYEGSGKQLAPLDWNFVNDPWGRANTYMIYNGFDNCLKGNGKGNRIAITYCDEADPQPNELWELTFLFVIPK